MLMRIAVQEAKKTIPDALAEVREAVDFCRYYAAQARRHLPPVELPGPTGERNVIHLEGRGAWVCIAPWNFPLAIFLGQVSAALAAGNSVVAKPASQTPEIAAYAVGLAHAAGIPEDALVLAVGRPEMGQKLMEDVRIAGVAFTGSTATAKRIARTLVADDDRPIIPLIAETGGINAMIVDSTALPEQVVQDVVTSAFRSAGQRCSALRLLVLQEDVAERTLEMLAGAMDSLIVGDPADPRTDVGPVIDQPSFDKLMGHRAAMQDRWIKTVPAPAEGLFVPPTLIRIDAIEDLRREWFGPLLHVTTWKGGELVETVRRINSSGFGLTMGLHSRIARAAETVEEAGTVGNLYVKPLDDRRHRRLAAVRRRGPLRYRPEGRRPPLSPALLHRTRDQHRHDQRRRQRHPAQPRGRRFLVDRLPFQGAGSSFALTLERLDDCRGILVHAIFLHLPVADAAIGRPMVGRFLPGWPRPHLAAAERHDMFAVGDQPVDLEVEKLKRLDDDLEIGHRLVPTVPEAGIGNHLFRSRQMPDDVVADGGEHLLEVALAERLVKSCHDSLGIAHAKSSMKAPDLRRGPGNNSVGPPTVSSRKSTISSTPHHPRRGASPFSSEIRVP
jgi:delta-1-pyrroline-5-carboxylate dehydrogenase PutA-like protein